MNVSPSESQVALAEMILLVAEMHESSYSQETNTYTTSIDAALKSLTGDDEDAGLPIRIMLKLAWNDSVEWATRILDRHLLTQTLEEAAAVQVEVVDVLTGQRVVAFII